MTPGTSSRPRRYHTVTPYLTVRDAPGLIAFLAEVFAAEVTERITRPDGTIGHADLRIGDAVVMLAEATAPTPARPGALYIYVDDTDATYRRALAAGATSLMEPAAQFYGDRSAGVRDAFGNDWWLATSFENVSAEQLQQRADAAMAR